MLKKHQVDLVLVNPGDRAQVYQALGKDLSAIEPPVWAGLMASFVRVKGFSVAVVDAGGEHLTAEETAKRVAEMNPQLTAVVVYGHQPSASTQNMTAAGRCCAALKATSPETPVIMVGGHVASLPERTMREEKADFVSNGEGLYTMTALLEALQSPAPQWNKVPDLWYRDNGNLCHSETAAPLLKNLDEEMPGIAWDLLPMQLYRAHNWHCFGHLQRQPYAAIYTTLGCPYHCSFCCIQAPFKSGEKVIGLKESANSYRLWSTKRIVDDLELLATKYGVRNVKFADELFVLKPGHVEGICDGIIERGLDFNIWAYARVDTVRDAMIEKLLRAGIRWLAFGVEAANARVRDDVQKGYGQERIFSTINRCRDIGIYVIANYIFGLPEDDLQTMQETLDMALALNAEFANLYCAMAYPGSQLYNTAVKENWPLPEKWTGYSQHSVDMLPLPTKHLPASEVIRFRDRAFQAYFNSPKYLDLVLKKFGPDTVEHIRGMASHKLERRFA
ncbi:MAG: cobalamin B12-binding domain-containing protein [Verrucomicrobia bacterium]|nr:cobalamin B12-binding domain-containing protein [Verrucomicrobiota bacterium]